MAPTRKDFEIAVAGYWDAKARQLAKAKLANSTAEGTAKATRGGGHFDSIAALIAKFFLDAGFPEDSIGLRGSSVVLPAHFRPTKSWDVVVVHEEVLVAAVELKALGGPSFGKNYNNRIEEALGSALDIDRASTMRSLGPEKPWLGYFFLMDDADGSKRPGKLKKNLPFEVDPVWHGLSYQQRFSVTGRRLMEERLYDAVCYVISSADEPFPKEPDADLDWAHFSAALKARLTYLSELGIPG